MVCKMGHNWPYSPCFVGAASVKKNPAASLYSSHLAFYLIISLKSKSCKHTVELTCLQLERIPNFFFFFLEFEIRANRDKITNTNL